MCLSAKGRTRITSTMYLLGYDMGSSTIKAALIKQDTKEIVGMVQYPDQDMDMISRQRGWAEQQPEVWWQHFCMATRKLMGQFAIQPQAITGIGLAYQMHGLVLIDEAQQVLRPSIIWCDSRAVTLGQEAFQALGQDHCLHNFLNSPGNFTASKLKWVKDNEPHIYERIHKILLPGDYIAMKLTGEAVTTLPGLTEGVFWNFREQQIATDLLDYYELSINQLAEVVPTFAVQGRVTQEASQLTGLAVGTPLTYRAGDQPNNALALNVLHPGEIAATSGTSGVVYGIVDRLLYDRQSRVNSFAHVNYEDNHDRIGTLLCLNGAGIHYSWIKHQIAREGRTYDDMERMASTVPVGAGGMCILPFGNGAERMFQDQHLGAHLLNFHHNRHSRADIYRASLEGIAFAFVYGMNILQEMGLDIDVIRVGNDNMFQSRIFATTISTLMGNQIEVVDTNGAVGAAKAAGVGSGCYHSPEEALEDIEPSVVYDPSLNPALCQQAYNYWLTCLQRTQTAGTLDSAKVDDLKVQLAQLKKENKEKNAQLAALTLKLDSQRNEMARLKQLAVGIADQTSEERIEADVKIIARKLDSLSHGRKDWDLFEEHFDLLHDDFCKRLKARHPALSLTDLKLCALIKLKLSTKEIAQQLSLSVRGVETRRYRLRQKLALSHGINIHQYFEQV